MPRGGETTHIEPDFGDDDLRRQRADTGDLIEALRGGQPVAATVAATVGEGGVGRDGRLGGGLGGGLVRVARVGCGGRTAGTAGLLVVAMGGEHGLQEERGAGGQLLDRGGQPVDLIEQHAGEFGVMLVEPAAQRLDQSSTFGFHPAPGQLGQPARIAVPGDERLEHVAHRAGVQLAGHRRHLDQSVFQQLLQPLPVPGAFPGQIHPQPGVIAQHSNLRRRHKRRSQQALLGELGQPHRIKPVRLGRPGRFFTSRALTNCTARPRASSR